MKRLIAIPLLIFYSCSALDGNRIAPGYSQAYTSIKNVFFGFENVIDPNTIDNIPYASILVRIGKGPEALMILERIDGDKLTWVSADGVYLITRKGKIVKTYGLLNNLKEIVSSFTNWNNVLDDNLELTSYYSFTEPDLSNLKVISKYTKKEETNLVLTFRSYNLFLIEEEINSTEVAWKYFNKYWIDENGFVWKSVQKISPRLPEIYIEVTKKPR